jgi:hypothetical protein
MISFKTLPLINKRIIHFILTIIILFTTLTLESEVYGNDFRVSGIIQTSEKTHTRRGLIELSNGKKITVKEGDTIEFWNVVRITDECLTLLQDKKTQEKCLTSSGKVTMPVSQPSLNASGQLDPIAMKSMAQFKHINKTAFLKVLDQLNPAASIDQLNETLMSIVNLPLDNQILTVEMKPITTTQNAIDALRQAIELKHPIKITLKTSESLEDVIYLQTETPN